MFVAYDQAWMDQSSSWWAKANRAKEHLDSLSCLVDEFRALGPYSLTAESTEKAGRLRHEFNLVLTDDPAFSRSHGIANDVVDVLEQWRQHIVDLVVFPRVFTIMSQAVVHT